MRLGARIGMNYGEPEARGGLKPATRSSRHGVAQWELRYPLRAGAAYCSRVEAAFLPEQLGKEIDRQIIFHRRRGESAAKRDLPFVRDAPRLRTMRNFQKHAGAGLL